jgi:hypothetical protein
MGQAWALMILKDRIAAKEKAHTAVKWHRFAADQGMPLPRLTWV